MDLPDSFVAATDLQNYLGLPSINSDRAMLYLSIAQQKCADFVAPKTLPQTGSVGGVILEVAGRAYTNPQQVQQASLGTGRIDYPTTPSGSPIGGVYLSRLNKRDLRAAVGSTGAFGVSSLPVGVNAVQQLTVAATAGTFTLAIGGAVSAALAAAASAASIQSALDGVTALGAGSTSVTGSGPFQIEFVGPMQMRPVPLLIVDATDLTGTATIITVNDGVFPPGGNLPPWDKDYYGPTRLLGQPEYGGPI